MINRQLAIGLVIGISIGLSIMAMIGTFWPSTPKQDDSILIKTIEQRDKQIKELKLDNKKLSILASKENDTVEIIKKIYVPIYKEIDRANRDDLNRAFDSLLTD